MFIYILPLGLIYCYICQHVKIEDQTSEDDHNIYGRTTNLIYANFEQKEDKVIAKEDNWY